MATNHYSVPAEANAVFNKGIVDNALTKRYLPSGFKEAIRKVSFEGSDKPRLPINWRFAESISALKAYEAGMVNVLLQRKYGTQPCEIRINTDHAQLFIMSSLLWMIDPTGARLTAASIMDPEGRLKVAKYFPDQDKHDSQGSSYKVNATNIYKTKDGRFFHLHGSMNPEPTLKSIDLPSDKAFADDEDPLELFFNAVGSRTSEEMQQLADEYKQAGTICWTIEQYKNSDHGKANADTGLFEIRPSPNDTQGPRWWPDAPHTSAARPLAGLKVVDLTRVIAGPAISRGLAELGASVMRITAPHITDLSALHPDLNHGKWNAYLDLRVEHDRQRLRELISEADVFLQGYRPGVLDKYGFGEKDILEIVSHRSRGIIYCGENCYGWKGPWAHRSGWQQISDACCGVSYEFGKAMGNDEPVTPVFPNSDYCTGVAGVVGIITALLRRAEEGGSFSVDVALNYYSQWLVDSVGTYPEDVWQDVWRRNGSPVFRHYNPMPVLLPRVMRELQVTSGDTLFRSEFFKQYHLGEVGTDISVVAPVLHFPNGEVKLGFDVGTRTNGVDQPRWPEDLTAETIS